MYSINSVIIKKPISLSDARELAQKFINNPKKTYYRETNDSYRFRDNAKTKFDKSTFRTKIINNKISIVMGFLI